MRTSCARFVPGVTGVCNGEIKTIKNNELAEFMALKGVLCADFNAAKKAS